MAASAAAVEIGRELPYVRRKIDDGRRQSCQALRRHAAARPARRRGSAPPCFWGRSPSSIWAACRPAKCASGSAGRTGRRCSWAVGGGLLARTGRCRRTARRSPCSPSRPWSSRGPSASFMPAWSGMVAGSGRLHRHRLCPGQDDFKTSIVRCDEAQWRLPLGLSLAGYNALISLAVAGSRLSLLLTGRKDAYAMAERRASDGAGILGRAGRADRPCPERPDPADRRRGDDPRRSCRRVRCAADL